MVDAVVEGGDGNRPAANAEQRDYWEGAPGRRWVDASDQYDLTLAPFADAVLDAGTVEPGERVLDVGCGAGTLAIAAAARGGHAAGVDISTTMIDAARARSADVEFTVGDVQTMSLDRFELVCSRFGVMFFDDPVAAFANLGRTGGRLAFVCWQAPSQNQWVAEPIGAIIDVLGSLPPGPPPDAPGPFAFADPDRVRSLLVEAGWSGVAIEPFETVIHPGGPGPVDVAAEFSTVGGPASRLLADHPDEVLAAVRQRMAERFERFHDGTGTALGAATWVVTARP